MIRCEALFCWRKQQNKRSSGSNDSHRSVSNANAAVASSTILKPRKTAAYVGHS